MSNPLTFSVRSLEKANSANVSCICTSAKFGQGSLYFNSTHIVREPTKNFDLGITLPE